MAKYIQVSKSNELKYQMTHKRFKKLFQQYLTVFIHLLVYFFKENLKEL